ncbi:23S rRNA (cytidine1920-2'-O)/16S rRNA (cytidine1409-2'-O)-methyltransferase [Fervidobacterium changbaicum]|uniref:TlyA family RNA methyltransferase n=2 Tax=Fervidobacterium TaxID=2422 RepID=A0AAI8GCQ8_FERIS|nr:MULTISPECIES: TlyA family RNA methyltransferase [Fervidobacterium]AMW32306.1 TlyA family RNA methyltransferase [Fervidobacterium islandicum]QAV32346.1 TlyA family RNA methyltransferase [Fervidobacterium changbaicum]SDH21789.1 23S rRNA (cytidine1920-2'-O)/16S rRNA (cytidine1409-2'-O)-methyltransferase [Fervidobacterium changbaicum]
MAGNAQKERLDVFLARNGLAESRNKAKQLIKTGNVIVNGEVCLEPSKLVGLGDKISIVESLKYVSRAGYKLEGLFKSMSQKSSIANIAIKDKVICDIGSSTGGFVDFFLQNNARKIYAVDVNTYQLHPRIATNERVIKIQKNAKDLFLEDLGEFVDIVSVDISFISVRKIKGNILNLLKEEGYGIILIKPQFEVGYQHQGVIKDKLEHVRVLREVLTDFLAGGGLRLVYVDFSKILGGDGNIEFFAVFQKDANCSYSNVLDNELVEVVNKAWEELF